MTSKIVGNRDIQEIQKILDRGLNKEITSEEAAELINELILNVMERMKTESRT